MSDPVRARVIVASDRATTGERPDEVGPVLRDLLRADGYALDDGDVVVVPDDVAALVAAFETARRDGRRLLVTTGGTGAAPRDVTPDATRAFVERELPGFGELLRAESLKVTVYAAGSRATAGTRGDVLVVNLPGSPRGAREGLAILAKPVRHVLDLIAGAISDCKPVRDAETR